MKKKRSSNLKLYRRAIDDYPLLNKEDEARLAKEMKAGSGKARETLILSNVRLVISFANSFQGVFKGAPFLDLIQEGMMGLFRAVDRFDPQRGKLSLYACWWIKKIMLRYALRYSQSIIVPESTKYFVALYKKKRGDLTETLGREPTRHEMFEVMAMTRRRFVGLELALKFTSSVKDMACVEQPQESRDDSASQVDREDLRRYVRDKKRGPLKTLDDRELRILELRFGFTCGVELTLRQVGKELDLSYEAVRLIESKILKKLAACPEFAELA